MGWGQVAVVVIVVMVIGATAIMAVGVGVAVGVAVTMQLLRLTYFLFCSAHPHRLQKAAHATTASIAAVVASSNPAGRDEGGGGSGRWLFRSGVVEKGGWVPWEVEALNLTPQTMIWTEGATAVTTTVAGLYRLTLGFFTHSAVVVQV